ncbi:MAG: hypothetical protein QME12_07335 [Nanoarchaeota archaeon]|nr:hypothetical protein [Nanoarchaeota archaeon]
MSGILFFLPGCHLCEEASIGINFINSTLPIGQKIRFCNIMSRRPELAFLANLFESNDPADWAVPVLLLEEKGINRVFDSYVRTNSKHRACARSVLDAEHIHAYIDEYMKGSWG